MSICWIVRLSRFPRGAPVRFFLFKRNAKLARNSSLLRDPKHLDLARNRLNSRITRTRFHRHSRSFAPSPPLRLSLSPSFPLFASSPFATLRLCVSPSFPFIRSTHSLRRADHTGIQWRPRNPHLFSCWSDTRNMMELPANTRRDRRDSPSYSVEIRMRPFDFAILATSRVVSCTLASPRFRHSTSGGAS